MEIIRSSEEQNTILLSEIDQAHHIIVGVDIQGNPLFFTPKEMGKRKFKALLLNDPDGDCYGDVQSHELIELISAQTNFAKLAAFDNYEYKKALQWLIDNATAER